MRETIHSLIAAALAHDVPFEVTVPERGAFGHYSANVALRLAKEEKKDPIAAAGEIAHAVRAADGGRTFEKVEVAPPGFINFWLTPVAIQEEFLRIAALGAGAGTVDIFHGARVMIEYTDPNPFKQFHIGHLMTNTIGESLARIHEAAGAEVLRVNYQGDVGLHVAKSVWGMMKLEGERSLESLDLEEKVAFLGRAYAHGARAYENDLAAKTEIETVNKKIYERSDPNINQLYDEGKRWSLEYFETLYARLGTKFVHYFFESEAGPDGLAIVKDHPAVFVKSEGAIIFPGEQYGLHNRVFVSTAGLPTYEAKELGLNKRKFDLYHPALSLIVTGNEIAAYFNVLLKAMELTVPEAAAHTRHLGHGMLRLPTGKMSSRTGDVIAAEWLIEEIKKAVAEKLESREGLTDAEREEIKEAVAIAAIRYSILKQSMGTDIIFDMQKSIAFQGDSGPYLQYTYARLASIARKSEDEDRSDASLLGAPEELALMRQIIEFPEAIRAAAESYAPNAVALYLYELANSANRFYESVPVLKEENAAARAARLLLVRATATVLKNGLALLGITAPEKV